MKIASALAALLLPTLLIPAMARAEPVRAHYAAFSNGLNALRVDAEFDIGPRAYRMRLVSRTAGTVGALFRFMSDTTVDGVFRGGDAAPRQFFSAGHARGRPRVTQVDYPDGQPVVRTLTPSNEEEREAVPAADQTGTIDSLSAMAKLVQQVNTTGRCDGRSRTYDGRRLSDITATTGGREVLEATSRSSFAGPALRCDLAGRQLGGFMLDADRAAVQQPLRGSVWFASVKPDGPLIPVRMTSETRFIGTITLYLVDPE